MLYIIVCPFYSHMPRLVKESEFFPNFTEFFIANIMIIFKLTAWWKGGLLGFVMATITSFIPEAMLSVLHLGNQTYK